VKTKIFSTTNALAYFNAGVVVAYFLGWGVSNPLRLSSSSALHFSDYSFWVHHLVNRDDRQLLANAMASDFSVAWQCLSKRTIVFFVMDKLHALVIAFYEVDGLAPAVVNRVVAFLIASDVNSELVENSKFQRRFVCSQTCQNFNPCCEKIWRENFMKTS
jgi:hypothetical protein